MKQSLKLIFGAAFLLLTAISCDRLDQCICPEIYSPVMGVNGKVYDNACLAECDGVDVKEQEPEDCICFEIYSPVCGSDGKTYSNSCYADCAGVQYTEGECQ